MVAVSEPTLSTEIYSSEINQWIVEQRKHGDSHVQVLRALLLFDPGRFLEIKDEYENGQILMNPRETFDTLIASMGGSQLGHSLEHHVGLSVADLRARYNSLKEYQRQKRRTFTTFDSLVDLQEALWQVFLRDGTFRIIVKYLNDTGVGRVSFTDRRMGNGSIKIGIPPVKGKMYRVTPKPGGGFVTEVDEDLTVERVELVFLFDGSGRAILETIYAVPSI